METCGFAPEDKYREIAPFVDIFLYDIKITNREEHKRYTGVYPELILSNLKMLDSIGARTVLRCPIIPGINDNTEHFRAIADIASSLAFVMRIEIEPYHPLGEGKCEKLGKSYPMSGTPLPDNNDCESWINEISTYTSVPVKKA